MADYCGLQGDDRTVLRQGVLDVSGEDDRGWEDSGGGELPIEIC